MSEFDEWALMTREKMRQGLDELVLRIANNVDLGLLPADWTPSEWSYLKGVACAQIMQLRDRLG